MFDNKMLNKIYMINDPRLFVTLYPTEAYPTYVDSLKPTVMFDKYDNLIIYDPAKIFNKINPKDYVGQYDEIRQLLIQLGVEDELVLSYKDMMEMYNRQNANDIIDLRYSEHIYDEIINKDKFNTEHIVTLSLLLKVLDKLELNYKDLIGNSHIIFTKIEEMKLKLEHANYTKLYNNEDYKPEDKLTLSIGKDAIDSLLLDYKDLIKEIRNIVYVNNELGLKEKNQQTQITDYSKEKFNNNTKYSTCIDLEKEDNVELLYNDSIDTLKGGLDLPNVDIYINDSIKVTYED
jgi:hypothetical protein